MLEIIINLFLFIAMLDVSIINHYETDVMKTSSALWNFFCWTLTLWIGMHVFDLLHIWLIIHHPQILNW